MSALSKPDRSNETAKTAAPPKPPGGGRPTFRRFLALFAVFCVAAALLPAVASAHDPTRTEITRQEPYEAQEQDGTKTVPDYNYKDVPAYNYVDVPQYEDVVTKKLIGYKNVRIPPFTKSERIPPYTTTKPVYNYETQCIWLGCFQVRVPPTSITVSLFNYKTVPDYNYAKVPQYEDVVTKKFIGNKKVRIPPYTKKERVAPFTKEVPKYKTVTKYRTVGTGQYTETHTPAGSHQCPTGQTPTSIDTYGHVSGCKQPDTNNDCTPGPNEHPHGNTCHADHATCDASKYTDETGTVYGHTSGDNHGQISVDGCKTRPNTGNCTLDNVPDGQHPHSRRGETFCHADHTDDDCPEGQKIQGHDTCVEPVTVDPKPCPAGYRRGEPSGNIRLTKQGSKLVRRVTVENRRRGEPKYRWEMVDGNEDVGQYMRGGTQGVRWETHSNDSACVKPIAVPNDGSLITNAIITAIDAGRTASEAVVSAYHTVDRVLYNTLCEFKVELGVAGTSGSAISAGAKKVLENAKVRAVAAGLSRASVTASGVAAACQITDWTGGAPGDSDDDSSQSVPSPASGLSASAGAGQIVVSWSASATTPADGFGYRVQWKLSTQAWGGAAVQSEDLDHGSDLATSYTITGLSGGSAYDVRVAAFNDQGVSTWADGTATPTAAAAAPDPASGLSLGAGNKQIAVSWSASATTPAAGFGYRVQWKLTTQAWGDAAARSEDLDHGSDLATSYTVTGLANGSAYDVRVAAFNANGVSTWITATATPAKPKPKPRRNAAPAMPVNVAASCETSGADAILTITWSAPASSPAEITGYGWLAFPNTALNSKRGTVKASQGDQNGAYTVTAQAEPGKRYSVAVYSASANNRSNYTLSVRAQCPS